MERELIKERVKAGLEAAYSKGRKGGRPKGKVESGIKYIKVNFMAGRQFKSHEDLCKQLRNWVRHYCHERIHGTTKEKPRISFENEERSALLSLPQTSFYMGFRGQRKVHKDRQIILDQNFYSVPFKYVGENVEVECDSKDVKVFYEDQQIALHAKKDGKGEFSTQISHYPKYKYYTPDSPLYLSKYREKMSSLGEATETLFSKIVQDHPYDWYRIVKGILSLRKTYSDEVIDLTCKRALAFGITHYRKIKRICESGCYHLPVPDMYKEGTSWKL